MKAVVVGGGIVGSAVSLELQKRGWEVTTLDSSPGATGVAAGILLPDSSKRATEDTLGSWCGQSLAAWQGEWLDLPMQEGALFFARDEASREKVERYAAWAKKQGLICGKISPEETALPLSRRVLEDTEFVLSLPEAKVLNTEKVLSKLHSKINLIKEKASRLLLHSGRALGVIAGELEIKTDIVIGACGWGDWGWSPIAPNILPWQGERILFEGFNENVPLIQTGDGALAGRGDGTLWAGVSFREDSSGRPLSGAIQEILNRAIDWLPGLKEARISSIQAGIRPGTRDYLPLLGETSIPGFYLATGHGRGGILSAPLSAIVLADIIENKKSEWKEILDPERSFK